MAPRRGGKSSNYGNGFQAEDMIDISELYYYPTRWVLYGELAVSVVFLIFTLALLVASAHYGNNPTHSRTRLRWFKWYKFALLLLFISYALNTARCVVQAVDGKVFNSFRLEFPFREWFWYLSLVILIRSAYYILWRSKKNSGSSPTYPGLQKWLNLLLLVVMICVVCAQFGFIMYERILDLRSESRYSSFRSFKARQQLGAAVDLVLWITVIFYQFYAIVLHALAETRQLPKTLLGILAYLALPGLLLATSVQAYASIHFTIYNLNLDNDSKKYHRIPLYWPFVYALIQYLGVGFSTLGFLLCQAKNTWDSSTALPAPPLPFADVAMDQPPPPPGGIPSMYDSQPPPKPGFYSPPPPHEYPPYSPPPPHAYSPPPHAYSPPPPPTTTTTPDPYRMSVPNGGFGYAPAPPHHNGWHDTGTWRPYPGTAQ